MRINITSVFVDDQAKALEFYTGKLGFQLKHDIPVGDGARWLTLVSPEDPEGTELLLEPAGMAAAQTFKKALVAEGVPFTQFAVTNLHAEYERLQNLGVEFIQEPIEMGPVITAVLDDTCGNYIQLVQPQA